jgi:CobQ-like glutamine amidotransferase family enzyme
MNKSSILTGVETPLLTALDLGFGNETKGGAEGIHYKNVFGSHLTGPLLAKNPRLLDAVITAIYEKRGETCPAIPKDAWAEEGYAVTARELKALCGK